jgi:protein required for attachment to host cells
VHVPNSAKTAIVTFNGAEAQAWLYDRPRKALAPLAGFPISGERKPDYRDQRSRSHASAGARRSAIEPTTDPEQDLERQLVRQVAAAAARNLANGDFSRLLVAASPRPLGIWREVASRDLTGAIWKELVKDYVGLDRDSLIHAIEDAFWA